MKARRPHRVPLSGRAVEILRQALELDDGQGLIFPRHTWRRADVRDGVHRLAGGGSKSPPCPHGFRTSFRNWVAECTAAPWAVAEAALAHSVGNSTEAAYMRSDLFDQRRALMSDWADYVTGGDH